MPISGPHLPPKPRIYIAAVHRWIHTHTINLLQIVSSPVMILAQFGRGVTLSKRICLLEVLWRWLEERDIISSLEEGKTHQSVHNARAFGLSLPDPPDQTQQ